MPTQIRLPAIASDFEAGTIAFWHKSVGDTVEAGDVLIDVETDKAVVEVEATDSGILGAIHVPDGTEDVAVNTVIGVLLADGESIDDIDASTNAAPAEPAAVPVVAETPSPTPAATTAGESFEGDNGRVFASPLARRIAAEHGIDLSGLKGRGPKGRILKADVETRIGTRAPVASKPPLAPPSRDDIDIPNNNVRKVIARRLTAAKQEIPHFYLTVDCEIDALLDVRKQVNAHLADSGIKVSVNDCVIKAVALALRDVPAANASWSEDAIRQYGAVDISVAVATDNGLITPIVRNADQKSLTDVSIEIRDLAKRAMDGKLKPDEFKGGGFSVSNLGMYGIKEFSAIINPPQSCILAVGAGEQRAVVRDGELAIATVMTCTLSVDHRSVDGAVGAEFLAAFKRYVQSPAILLLDRQV